MNRKLKLMGSLGALAIILLFITAVLVSESRESYAEPAEAFLAATEGDNEVLLIPAYNTGDEALFFFMQGNSFGAGKVHKGFFGWKADFRTWSPMGELVEDQLTGSQGHGGEVFYGLFRSDSDLGVRGEDIFVNTIDLEATLYEQRDLADLDNLYLWFYETPDHPEANTLTMYDLHSNETIDTMEIRN